MWGKLGVFVSGLAIISSCLQDGDKFWSIPECYIRGDSIKYLRIPDEVLEEVPEEEEVTKGGGRGRGRGRGGRGGRGRGANRGRGGARGR